MGKRLIETDRWKKEWYRKLGPRLRDIRQYVLDTCNHAGIWQLDLGTASHFTGETVLLEDIQQAFRGHVVLVENDKLFIPDFFEFQYRDAKEGFKAKISAIKILTGYGLLNDDHTVREEFYNSTITVPIQLPNCTSICISKSKIKSTSKSKKEECEEKTKPKRAPSFDFEPAYRDYPRHEGKAHGMERLPKLIRSDQDFQDFCLAVKNYASLCQERGTEVQHIKLWSSFVGTEKIQPWREYVKPPKSNLKAPDPEAEQQAMIERIMARAKAEGYEVGQ